MAAHSWRLGDTSRLTRSSDKQIPLKCCLLPELNVVALTYITTQMQIIIKVGCEVCDTSQPSASQCPACVGVMHDMVMCTVCALCDQAAAVRCVCG